MCIRDSPNCGATGKEGFDIVFDGNHYDVEDADGKEYVFDQSMTTLADIPVTTGRFGKKYFRKERMLARIKEEGLMDMVDEQTMQILNAIDGCEMLPNLWRQTIYGEDAYYVQTDDGKQYPVNPSDCEESAGK